MTLRTTGMLWRPWRQVPKQFQGQLIDSWIVCLKITSKCSVEKKKKRSNQSAKCVPVPNRSLLQVHGDNVRRMFFFSTRSKSTLSEEVFHWDMSMQLSVSWCVKVHDQYTNWTCSIPSNFENLRSNCHQWPPIESGKLVDLGDVLKKTQSETRKIKQKKKHLKGAMK